MKTRTTSDRLIAHLWCEALRSLVVIRLLLKRGSVCGFVYSTSLGAFRLVRRAKSYRERVRLALITHTHTQMRCISLVSEAHLASLNHDVQSWKAWRQSCIVSHPKADSQCRNCQWRFTKRTTSHPKGRSQCRMHRTIIVYRKEPEGWLIMHDARAIIR